MSSIVSLFHKQHRSRDTFTRLLRPYIAAMYRMAFRWTRDRQRAEDLVQDVLTDLASRMEELQAVDKLRPWLIKVLYRRFVDQYRRQSRRPEVVQSDLYEAGNPEQGQSEAALFGSYSDDPGTPLDLQRQLRNALMQLDAGQRDVVLLHDAEGYTDSEVAEILSISRGTVKSRLHRGRKKIKNYLSREPFGFRQRVRG